MMLRRFREVKGIVDGRLDSKPIPRRDTEEGWRSGRLHPLQSSSSESFSINPREVDGWVIFDPVDLHILVY